MTFKVIKSGTNRQLVYDVLLTFAVLRTVYENVNGECVKQSNE